MCLVILIFLRLMLLYILLCVSNIGMYIFTYMFIDTQRDFVLMADIESKSLVDTKFNIRP